jgi:exodeoxyribonuclease VII small subunit
MEKGELALEQSLKQFERGVQLAAVSSQKLESAQQKVKILMGEGDNATPVDFNE